MPAISIIIPVYKVELYLEQALTHILQQTFRDFEAICINDGSPDRCPDILDAYAKKDPRIKVITQHNQGVSAARNAGLHAAEGDYITFADPDDAMHPQFLELLYHGLSEHDADFSWCSYQPFTHDTELVFSRYEQGDAQQLYHGVWQRTLFNQKPHPNVTLWNKLIKKELIRDLSFDTSLSIGEDFLYSYQYLTRSKSACYIKHSLVRYRTREDSAMNRAFDTSMAEKNIDCYAATFLALRSSELPSDQLTQLHALMSKFIVKALVLLPYKRDRSNCKAHWNTLRIRAESLIKDGTLSPRHLSWKYRLLCHCLLKKHDKCLKLLCKI